MVNGLYYSFFFLKKKTTVNEQILNILRWEICLRTTYQMSWFLGDHIKKYLGFFINFMLNRFFVWKAPLSTRILLDVDVVFEFYCFFFP